jgi:hypothetical protein
LSLWGQTFSKPAVSLQPGFPSEHSVRIDRVGKYPADRVSKTIKLTPAVSGAAVNGIVTGDSVTRPGFGTDSDSGRCAKHRCYVFHQNGRPIGDVRKVWQTACKALGLQGRIAHDPRRSGVRHLIQAGVDPHTVMAFSGHRTDSMLKRYHIIALDDLRRAAERGSAYERDTATGRWLPCPRRAENAQSNLPLDVRG